MFLQNFSYDYIISDPVINGFSTNEVRSHLNICYHLIITFGNMGLYLGFSNTYYVDSFDIFREAVVEKVKIDIDNFMGGGA